MAVIFARGILALFFLFSTCFAQKISLSAEQHAVLERFFQVLMKESEVGYVLLGKKPVCIHGFFHKDPFFVDTILHKQAVALREGARIWQQLAPASGDVSIHVSEEEDLLIPNIIHVIAVHHPLLREVLTENIALFQYILGPSVTPEILFTALTSEKTTYHSFLKEDKVLVGEILGFGIQNALYVSRIENIEEELERDIPPFANMQSVMCEYPQEYLPVKTSFGFKSLREELNALQNRVSLPSEKLMQSSPEFVFGCLKETEETHRLISELEKAQTDIQTCLNSQPFLEKMLCKFTNKEYTASPGSDCFVFQFDHNALNMAVAKGIWESVQDYDHEFLPHFISGIAHHDRASNAVDRFAYFPSYRREMIEAKNNLSCADDLFASLGSEKDIKCIVPERLYYKVLKSSNDERACEGSLISLEYSIFSPLGHCLVHESDRRINLKNTIPGFALGIKGMKVKETREIFIHPSYAYGFDTSLDKCLALRVIVTLQEIYDNTPYSPSINNIDLSFIRDKELLNKRTNAYKAALTEKGKLLGTHLKKCPQIDLNLICRHLKKFQNNRYKFEPTTDEEQILINQMHWNIYNTES